MEKFNAEEIAQAIRDDARMPTDTYVEVGASPVTFSPHRYVYVYPTGGVPGECAMILVSEESEYESDSQLCLVGVQSPPDFENEVISSVSTIEGVIGEVVGFARQIERRDAR